MHDHLIIISRVSFRFYGCVAINSANSFKTMLCFLKSEENIFYMNSNPKSYSATCLTLSTCSGLMSSKSHLDFASNRDRLSLLPALTISCSSSSLVLGAWNVAREV